VRARPGPAKVLTSPDAGERPGIDRHRREVRLLRFGAENEATAIRLATARTFRPELLSNFSSTRVDRRDERNDLGAFASPIPFAL